MGAPRTRKTSETQDAGQRPGLYVARKANVPASGRDVCKFGRKIERTTYLYVFAVGCIKRVQPVVFTVRNSGVRGGNSVGLRKLVSKL